jgi:hypothetical protein
MSDLNAELHILVGAAVLLCQHLIAREGESWLKRWGLWPR